MGGKWGVGLKCLVQAGLRGRVLRGRAGVICLGLLLALVLSAPALAYESYGFVPDFPLAHLFDNPGGIAAGPDGRLYIADTYRHRIQVFDPSGSYVREFGWGTAGSSPGQFYYPYGVSVAPDGTVYVADTYNHRIQAFDADGNFLRMWGSQDCSTSPRPDGALCYPRGLAADVTGYVYVADTNNHRVQVFDPDGNFIRKWGRNGGDGSAGAGAGEFSSPIGIAVAPTGTGGAGEVYVADQGNHRVQVFSPRGTYKRLWGGVDCWAPLTDGAFCSPDGITVAPTGGGGSYEVYVTDTGNHRIQVFTKMGAFVRKWGTNGSAGGEMSSPEGVTVAAGKVFVADAGNDRIQRFTTAGAFEFLWGAGYGSGPGKFYFNEGVGFDGAGNVYVTDRNNHRIQAFDPQGNFLWQRGSYGSGNGQFSHPDGLYTDVAGYTYVSDTGNHRIQVFDAAGNFVTKFGSYGSGNGQFNYPHDIDVDVTGHVYVTDGNNHRVQVFVYDEAAGFTFAGKWGGYGSGDGQFNFADHVDIGPDGHIYVTDHNNHRVQDFVYDAVYGQYNFVRQIGSYGTDPGKFYHPRSVRLDADGNIYVTDQNNQRVQKIAPDGVTVLAVWGGVGNSPGRFAGSYSPYGLAITADGNEVYVTDPNNHRVQKFRRNQVDTVPPELSHDVNCTWGWSSWCTSDAFVTLTATDVGSTVTGVAYTRYKIDNGGWNSYYAPFAISAEGIHTVRAYTVDTAGNRSSDRLFTVKIDKTPPVIAAVYIDGGAASTGSFNVTLTVYASDPGSSGLYQMRVKNVAWGSYDTFSYSETLPWELVGGSQHGPRAVYVQVNDQAGNTSAWVSDSIDYQPPYLFDARWGNSGGGAGQFSYPIGVGVDGDDNVYVADRNNHRIQVFRPEPDGTFTFLRQWGSYNCGGAAAPNGTLCYPGFVAVDAVAGYVYVSDTNNHRIQVFNLNGGFIRKFGSYGSGDGQLHNPQDLALDANGNVYVADYYNHRVMVFNRNGNYLRKWGSSDCSGVRDNGKFCYPNGIAVDPALGFVYVTDRLNHRVQVFNLTGNFRGKWGKGGGMNGEAGSGDGEFNEPLDVEVDGAGGVFVSDYLNHGVQKFVYDAGTGLHTFAGIWGGYYDFNRGACAGSGFTGFMCYPIGLAMDSQGRVLVSDYYAHRVQRFIPAGWMDTLPPATTALPSGTAGPGGWSVEVNFTATDADSGVAWTVYRVDGGDWQTCPGTGSGSLNCGPFAVSGTGPATYLLEFQSADMAGHVEPLRQRKMNIDQWTLDTQTDWNGYSSRSNVVSTGDGFLELKAPTTWASQASNTSSVNMSVYAIDMVSGSSGKAVAGNGTDSDILSWNGAGWSLDTTIGGMQLYDVDAVSGTAAWAAGGSDATGSVRGYVYYWDGATWTQITNNKPAGNYAYAVSMLDGDYGWTAGRNGRAAYCTTNCGNGANWTAVIPFTVTIRDMQLLSSTSGWAVGDGTSIWQFSGGTTWTRLTNATTPQNPLNASGPALYGVHAVSANDAWAVGAGGKVLYFDGTNWVDKSAEVNRPTLPMYGVHGVDTDGDGRTNKVWIVGGNRKIGVGTCTWNGSALSCTWSFSNAPGFTGSKSAGRDVFMHSAVGGWAGGDESRIFRYGGYPSSGNAVYVFDAGQVVDWIGHAHVSNPGASGSVAFQWATSNNGVGWSGWSSNIGSVANSRYLKQKVTLSTTDWLETPRVDNSVVTYVFTMAP